MPRKPRKRSTRLAIPRRIRLRGKVYRVRYTRKLGDKMGGGAWRGLCEPDTATIWIDPRQPREERERTFLHEVLHGLLPETYDPTDTTAEERIVTALEGPLHDLLLTRALAVVPAEEMP
jgi:hypothetical protein